MITAVRRKLYNCKMKYFYTLSNIMMEDETAGQVERTENIGMSAYIMSKTFKARCTAGDPGVNRNKVLILGVTMRCKLNWLRVRTSGGILQIPSSFITYRAWN
jgi:hypothetical protein